MKRFLSDQRWLLLTGLVLTAMASYTTFLAVPSFSGVFESFADELPLLTRLLLRFYPALLAMPAAVLLAWHLWPRKQSRGLAALLTAVAVSVAMPLALTLIMYLPVVAARQ